MVRIASYNVENLFSRPKALDPTDWSKGKPILKAFGKVNELLAKPVYSANDKTKIKELFVELDLYYINNQNAVRRKRVQDPDWAWFRKNHGKFDKEPKDKTKDVEIIASGRKDWIGWVSLAKEAVNEINTRMTAKVIEDVYADIIGIVEAEDRPSLCRFNDEMLGGLYSHVMLIDGNDKRGIDVGIMTGEGFDINCIKSNVDTVDATGIIFSRDCPQYTVFTPNGTELHLLINHFKSKSGGGDKKRQRQAAEVRKIVDDLVSQGKHVVVMGDLNEGPGKNQNFSENLKSLYDSNSPLVECFTLPGFNIGNREGTYSSCSLSNRFDYIFISKSLLNKCQGGGVFRKGLWCSLKTASEQWEVYPDITKESEQASDHGAVFIDLNI
ncbi:MAG: endonuclease/exonuclease/phosphatase family protein [Candidatus Zixiibacteriota bacterium]